MTRVVTHVTRAFLPLSEAWLYDVVTAPTSYEARVLTVVRENEEQFPFEPVTLLATQLERGSLAWFHHHLYHRLGWPRTPANSWKRSLRRHGRPASLFHAHYGWVGWWVVDAGLSPVITSFYGVDASEARTLSQWRVAYRRLFSRGAAFVAEGPAMRARLVDLGAPEARTHVVPLVVHLDDAWEPASLGGEPPRILMAGRLVEKKGFEDGIAAFGEARRAGVEARLVVMGDGPEEERLREMARSQGVERDVEFLPPQPRARFRQIVRSCHVFLQPSRTASDGDAEGGAPTTLLEAQALGRIVVATDHADIPHVVDQAAAYLSPERDVPSLAANLIAALTATEEWIPRATAGRRFVERQHSRERVTTLLERLYDDVTDA